MQVAAASRVPVLIVGAGPTGLAAANLLGARGIQCLVAEREEGIHPLPRAVHFDDEALRILQSAGLADAAREISRPIPGMQLLDAEHRLIVAFDRERERGPLGHPESSFFDQPDLEAVLRRGLSRFPHVELRERTEVLAIEPLGHARRDPLRVTLHDRSSGSLFEVSSQAVLACDGARSRTRAFVGAEIDDLRFEERWLVVDVRTPEPLARWDGCQQVADPKRPATYVPVGTCRYRWEFMVMPGETTAEMLRPERVKELLEPWLEGAELERVDVFRSAVYTFHALVARPWRRGRVFLLGDAAHQTPPFLGQGLCAGLRDAANLAWKLALVLDGRAREEILDTYEEERRPHARRVIQMAVLLGRAMLTGGPRAKPSDRLFRALLRVPGFSKRLPRISWPAIGRGPLVFAQRRRDGAGLALPQPRIVRRDGKELLLDDALGPGFAVVWAGEAPGRGIPAADRGALEGLGASFVRADALDDWLREHSATLALVRPDRIVAATGTSRDVNAWITALRAAGIGACGEARG